MPFFDFFHRNGYSEDARKRIIDEIKKHDRNTFDQLIEYSMTKYPSDSDLDNFFKQAYNMSKKRALYELNKMKAETEKAIAEAKPTDESTTHDLAPLETKMHRNLTIYINRVNTDITLTFDHVSDVYFVNNTLTFIDRNNTTHRMGGNIAWIEEFVAEGAEVKA